MKKILKYILKQLARMTIWRFNPDIIAITGSVGKTSAKEAIYAILKNSKRVRKSSGNLNNELGMPLAVISDFSDEQLKIISRSYPAGKSKFRKMFFWMKAIILAIIRIIFLRKSSYPQVLILEYGADRPGDIRYLLGIVKPKIAVITAIGNTPVHLEFYENVQAVAKEKSKIIENLFTSNFAVLNFDDEMVLAMKEKTRAKIITYGFDEKADIRITNFENKFENEIAGISFKLEYEGSFVPIVLENVFGKAHAYAVAAAATIGTIYGLNLVKSAEFISAGYKPAKRRMNLTRGVKNTYIIDDSYNASPLSMKQALETLRDLKAERKIAVLGDMLELGECFLEAHKKIGKLAAESANFLVTVGEGGKIIASAAKEANLTDKNIFIFNKAEEAIEFIKKIIKNKDLILIKASRGIGLDKIADALIV